MRRWTNQQGFSVIMAVVAMLLLGGMAATTLSIVSTTQSERASDLAAEQAFGLVQAGIEYAKYRIDQGLNPVVTRAPLGAGTFTVAADPAAGGLVVTGEVGAAKRTHTLVTRFGAQCLELNVSQAHSAANNLVGMKLRKTCLTKATITHWTIAWEPNLEQGSPGQIVQERTVRLQVTGQQLETLYDYPQGYPSGTQIDAVDFTLTRDNGWYPVNKVEFHRTVIPGKMYTVTLLLGDGSTVRRQFRDLVVGGAGGGGAGGGGGGGGGNPLGIGQGFEVTNNGYVVVGPSKSVRVNALCAEITYGAGGPKVPVKAWLGAAAPSNPTPQSYLALFGGANIKGGEQHLTNSGPVGQKYIIQANAKYGVLDATYNSTQTQQAKTLLNGATPPPLAGFGGQKPVTQCLQPYLNAATGKVRLNSNQAIILFELGTNMQQNPNSPAADFQDLVMLLTVD